MITYFGQPVTVQGAQASSLIFLHPGDVENTGNSVRANNAVRYMNPAYRGLTFSAEYSLGGVADNFTSGSGYSLGIAYANGPFTFGSAFEYFKNPSSTTPGAGFFTQNASGASVVARSIRATQARPPTKPRQLGSVTHWGQ
jgi:predicted porin